MTATIKKRRQKRASTAYDRSDPFFEVAESVALLEQAVEGNQRQINEVSRNTNQAIKDVVAIIEKQGAQTSTRLENLAESFQASQRPNYMLYLAAIAIFFTLISAGWKITDLQTQVTMAPIAAKADVSEKDRAEIHTEVRINKDELARQNSQQQVFISKLAEVETQFRASDRSRNIQFSDQQRVNNIMMQLAQGKGGKDNPIDYPTSPYYFPETTPDSNQQ